MSKIDNFRRELRYNAKVFQVLAEKEIPYLVWHGPDGRTVEAKTPVKGLAILFKTTPMPEGKVLLIVKPTGMKPWVEEITEAILLQRIHNYVRKILS
ncbi:hypothetical protein Fullmetal_21 [Microbacterium phage Fullmetal]|uniref:Uncharacterized protein n=5 Tax=Akonivirus phedro TaxID=2845594 RepID=A0A6M3T3M6_9CAUD|nr:hypothetical protein HWD33_gp21 [Microbacterium phage Phedro]QFG04943.1 hypothetical protein SEA_PHRIEDRICE_21 [Microbacterium phage PhriedRice]QJD52873.1 hypothetical protein SEA_PHRACTURED_21 [Microbacterium phage Phractured]QJD52983.1 hypothetical protein SEA_PHARKY_21 [Microbacterium phage Pharky]QNL30324.1 hypothetical protein SEA_MAZUN_22 [Microbacterium phage Mazun]QPL14174.1 hypothetical protein SEA_ATRAXI_20 [Microbacterium phage Atraxi]QWY82713.1 hypothetical protein SEA_STAGEPHR